MDVRQKVVPQHRYTTFLTDVFHDDNLPETLVQQQSKLVRMQAAQSRVAWPQHPWLSRAAAAPAYKTVQVGPVAATVQLPVLHV